MPRSLVARVLLAGLFAITALAVPGEAVAHGVSHHWAHEAGEHAGAGVEQHDVAIGEAGHDHEHGHPQLDGATRTRGDAWTMAPAKTAGVPAARLVPTLRVVPIHRATLARGDPHTGPPPRLRAPPAR